MLIFNRATYRYLIVMAVLAANSTGLLHTLLNRGKSAAADEAKSGELRVMSFNIRFGTAKDGDNHWDKRRELVAETVRRYDPDLLGTQETIRFQGEYLQQQLPHLSYVGWSRDANEQGEQCGVMFRTDRFELLDSGQFWLSETPEQKFSKSWDSSLPRVATWVRLRDQRNSKQLLFVNTHFDHRGKVARLESAAVIRKFVEQNAADIPVIVTGDFNCGEQAEPYKQLTGSARLRDIYRELHSEQALNEGTFNAFKGIDTGARIDWILASDEWEVKKAAIDGFSKDGRYPSDHFPVTGTLQLK
ncbi:MAG: endonuclease/exonuclease/phosphatase family protein [Fuerstiella sp.]